MDGDQALEPPQVPEEEDRAAWERAAEPPEDSVEGYDRSDHRVRFTITGDALSPGSDIVLRIRGEARETVDGGSVVLTLPTQTRLGRDYLDMVDVALPEQARWDLPSMAKGDVWERTATVPSVEAGYYLAGLSAENLRPVGGTVHGRRNVLTGMDVRLRRRGPDHRVL